MLFSIDGKLQPEIGKADYWNFFKQFNGSELHDVFVKRMEILLEGESINSLHSGAKIIPEIEKEHSEIFKEHPEDQIGSLWGMTMWHLLASHAGEWRFHRITNNDDETTGTFYFKK